MDWSMAEWMDGRMAASKVAMKAYCLVGMMEEWLVAL
jgi:hypothetical protein